MAHINGKTHLFDGLDFNEAVAVYWRVLEEARKVEGPVPNHHAGWVNQHREGDTFHTWAVESREKIRERDGYLFEEFPFLGFVIEKGNGANEFVLLREKLFPRSWAPMECVAQTHCSWAKNAADVAESTLGFVMQIELNAMIPEAAYYEVMVKDTTKVAGHTRRASTMKEAMEIKRELEDGLYTRERGNVITEATITVNGIGKITFPAYGQPCFVPNPRRRPEPVSDERFAEIVAAHARRQEAIRKLWGFITQKYDVWNKCRFEFEGTTYLVSANPNSRAPESCQIARHYIGSRSWCDLFTALDSGLLEAWAKNLGYED